MCGPLYRPGGRLTSGRFAENGAFPEKTGRCYSYQPSAISFQPLAAVDWDERREELKAEGRELTAKIEGFRYVDAKEGEVSQAAEGQAPRQGLAWVYHFLR
jgi:hypothetical protein